MTQKDSLCTGNVSELLQRRDAAALASLIEWYRPLLRVMASRDLDRSLSAKVDASDLVQEAFQDVARNFQTLEMRNRFQFVHYLKTVLKHKIEDVRRRFIRSQKRSVSREQSISILEHGEPEVPPLQAMFQRDSLARLDTVMERMPSELQLVLRWRFQMGMTYKQIGLTLERSEDDVRMLIKRCLARMKTEVFPNGSSD